MTSLLPLTHDWFAAATQRRREIARELDERQFGRCADCGHEFLGLEGMLRCSSCQAVRARRATLRVVR